MKSNRILILATSLSLTLGAHAQVSRLSENVEYKVEASEMGATGHAAPLWFSANRHGLSSTENTSGYVRAAIERKIETDSTHHWKFGYGVDVAVPYGFTSKWVVQQLYGEAQWHKFRVSFGSKERTQEFKDDELSTGGMTFSTNARPVPQLRAELADWWNITGRAHFLSIKGHASYGMMTDGDWQERFVGGEESNNIFAKKTLYHSKAGYFKLGDERRFPLTGMFGLEMVAMFSGEVWNIYDRGGSGNENFDSHVVMSHGIRDFVDAFIPGGADVNDGAFSNAAGNQLGSWVFSLDWTAPTWALHGYLDHFFDDHSQMFFQYGWVDNLVGIEARLPKNPFVSTIVYEHLNTSDQSGSLYHDATSVLPLQISGKDTYYNHHIYGAYHHWGQVMGNPLLLSPLYNDDNRLILYNNRVRANHIGLRGNPCNDVSWRALCTFHHALGTYDVYVNDAKSVFFMAEANYTPHQLNGWEFSLGLGANTGDLIGNSFGMQATVRKTGLIHRLNK